MRLGRLARAVASQRLPCLSRVFAAWAVAASVATNRCCVGAVQSLRPFELNGVQLFPAVARLRGTGDGVSLAGLRIL